MPIRVGRACRGAVLLCGVVSAIAPAAALASTYTVDDDKLDCPNASFTSIQAAINQAAPHDTIKVCAGVYKESSTPVGTTGTNMANPLQSGARNGLTINEALNIVGAGASKVIIEPDPAAFPTHTLAGTAPYLRDGGGNVITIGRQSLGSTDFSEAPVNISGVTIESPDVYAEAGVAFFNQSGSITDSVIGPLASAASVGSTPAASPYGYGIIATNSLQGAGLGTARRQVTVKNSLVTGYQAGGIFFDDAFGADGAATTNQRSGIIQYGTVDHTRVIGSGSAAVVPQTGITYRAGERGSVTDSEVSGNLWTADPSKSAGILLADAQTDADPNQPAQPGFRVAGTNLTANGYGLFNADISGTAVRTGAPAQAPGTGHGAFNYWGCSTSPTVGISGACQGISGNDSGGAPSVSIGAVSGAYAPLSVPAGIVDHAPTISIRDPLNGSMATAGVEIDPVVVAKDDYGVKSVTLTADGVPVATLTHAPYEFSYTPPPADDDRTVFLSATAVDSSGNSSITSVSVGVLGTNPSAGAGAGAGGGSTGGGSTSGGSTSAGSTDSGASPSAPSTTPSTPVAPSGPAAGAGIAARIVYPKTVKGLKKLKLVTVTCTDAAAKSCTVRITGTLKVGKKTVKVTLKGTVTGSDPKAFVLTLSKSQAKLLKGKKGTLKLTTVVTSSTGATAKASKTLSVKGA